MDKEKGIRVSYDAASDILYLLFKKGPSEDLAEAGSDVVLEMDGNGNIMGLEILNARKNGIIKKLANISR